METAKNMGLDRTRRFWLNVGPIKKTLKHGILKHFYNPYLTFLYLILQL